jgi:serine/threonine protein kinase
MSSSSTATISVPPVAPVAAKPMPAQIGKYRVLGRLGDGATSEVFLGFDDFQGRNVAIKRVRSSTAADPVDGHYSERFFAAEAALVGKLQHPNVVQIFDAVRPGQPYLVMEYVAGGTLRPAAAPTSSSPSS